MRTALVACLLAACGGTPATSLFALPGTPADDFYALPFPNDVYKKPGGGLDLSTYPANSLTVEAYRDAAEELDGFGTNSAIFARFDGPLDPGSLPDAGGSMQPSASVYLVNVDPESPQKGERIPVLVRFRAEGTQTLGANSITARPFPGFNLDDATTYALVITNRVRSSDNGDTLAAASFGEVMGTAGGPEAQLVRDAYGPLLAYLDEPGDDERGDVVSATVFTTQTATAIAPAIRQAIFALPAPTSPDVAFVNMSAVFEVYTGTYTAPNFQEGDVPYRAAPSGRIVVGADGAAVVQRMEPMRYNVTVPMGAVPANGFPIVIYAHGTGGDFTSFVDDGTALALAEAGLAVISTDQVLHGPRNPGGNPEIDFFNFGNPYAMRDNALQGAADAFSQLRLATGLQVSHDGRDIKFDPTKVYFFGHSQGGVTGPGFVAFEASLSGAVMSGTGGLLYLSLLHKTQPFDIPTIVASFLRDQPIDEDNPTLALAQMWVDRSDGANYAPLMARKPPPGNNPKNIYQLEGFTDNFTPNPCIEAFATGLGGDIVELPDAVAIQGLELRGRSVVAAPISKNLNGVTAVLAQFEQRAGSDGHFVVFDIQFARHQAAEFLGSLARTGTATVVP
jgi:predicted esterase